MNRVFSDDERSDQGVPVGFRKPPLPLQPVQHKAGASYNLPSPDSVARYHPSNRIIFFFVSTDDNSLFFFMILLFQWKSMHATTQIKKKQIKVFWVGYSSMYV